MYELKSLEMRTRSQQIALLSLLLAHLQRRARRRLEHLTYALKKQ